MHTRLLSYIMLVHVNEQVRGASVKASCKNITNTKIHKSARAKIESRSRGL